LVVKMMDIFQEGLHTISKGLMKWLLGVILCVPLNLP